MKRNKNFPNAYKPFGRNIKVKVDLSIYEAKADIKNNLYVDTSSFALKTILVNLKTEVDQSDIDKLVPVPNHLSKLSDIVKRDVVKKNFYDKLVAKVNNIDTSDFVLKTKYDTDKLEHLTDFVQKAKLTELENKIPDTSNLATKTALTAVENKIPSFRNLVNKK